MVAVATSSVTFGVENYQGQSDLFITLKNSSTYPTASNVRLVSPN